MTRAGTGQERPLWRFEALAHGVREMVRRSLVKVGLYRIDRLIKQRLGIRKKYWMNSPPWGPDIQREVTRAIDVVRYGAIALAVTRVLLDKIPGEFAEGGVYQGELSRFIASLAPDSRLHLFDTFSGFDPSDVESPRELLTDTRFRDTSVETVRRRLGALSRNVVFHPGWFPDTASELRDEKFAFVMLDFDKYKPTIAGLQVFYPRLERGGFLFLHDYNSAESERGVARALHEFLADKPELPVEYPDRSGSVVIRKL